MKFRENSWKSLTCMKIRNNRWKHTNIHEHPFCHQAAGHLRWRDGIPSISMFFCCTSLIFRSFHRIDAPKLASAGLNVFWALVSEPGFLKFQIFRFSILEIFLFWKIYSKIMLVRYRGINNKGVLEKPWTKWRVLRAISSTLKFQFTVIPEN